MDGGWEPTPHNDYLPGIQRGYIVPNAAYSVVLALIWQNGKVTRKKSSWIFECTIEIGVEETCRTNNTEITDGNHSLPLASTLPWHQACSLAFGYNWGTSRGPTFPQTNRIISSFPTFPNTEIQHGRLWRFEFLQGIKERTSRPLSKQNFKYEVYQRYPGKHLDLNRNGNCCFSELRKCWECTAIKYLVIISR